MKHKKLADSILQDLASEKVQSILKTASVVHQADWAEFVKYSDPPSGYTSEPPTGVVTDEDLVKRISDVVSVFPINDTIAKLFFSGIECPLHEEIRKRVPEVRNNTAADLTEIYKRYQENGNLSPQEQPKQAQIEEPVTIIVKETEGIEEPQGLGLGPCGQGLGMGLGLGPGAGLGIGPRPLGLGRKIKEALLGIPEVAECPKEKLAELIASALSEEDEEEASANFPKEAQAMPPDADQPTPPMADTNQQPLPNPQQQQQWGNNNVTQNPNIQTILEKLDFALQDEVEAINFYGELQNLVFYLKDGKILKRIQEILGDERDHVIELNELKQQLISPQGK